MDQSKTRSQLNGNRMRVAGLRRRRQLSNAILNRLATEISNDLTGTLETFSRSAGAKLVRKSLGLSTTPVHELASACGRESGSPRSLDFYNYGVIADGQWNAANVREDLDWRSARSRVVNLHCRVNSA
jgi:hypothetical protein